MHTAKLNFSNFHIKLKNSLFCGLKGWTTFNLAAISLLEMSLYEMHYSKHMTNFQRTVVTDNKENAKHQIRKHLIPFFEAMLVMPTLFLATHYFGNKIFPTLNPLQMHLICLAACIILMIMICLTLRILSIRKDCCGPIKHPIYRNPNLHNNDFINFKRPGSINKLEGSFVESTNIAACTIKTILFSMLMTPLIGIKAAAEFILCITEILELPFSFLLDLCILLYNTLTHSQMEKKFSHSKANLENIASLLYAGSRDLIVTCSFGILNAKIIKQEDGTSKSPISYLDELLTITSKQPRCRSVSTLLRRSSDSSEHEGLLETTNESSVNLFVEQPVSQSTSSSQHK
ncbi:hypothetical protein ECHOSC_0344 [Ehrlichia chaffeensis str. Osceola]|nr:hypothetical protein ECHJAX_0721 [Ehrlichia chaffeensis str. Jax]AHX07384.1 hypothetical protein ECHOSC_0344 [Ehrlichia chaffeensis str. Osceola]